MEHITTGHASPATKTRWYRQLYFWVLTAIVAGILVGWLAPNVGIAMEPIGTTFVDAMKMLIGPIVFLTIVGGIASVADLKKVGMTGLKALTYFQVGTICAMVFGLVAINLFRLGDGVNADASKIETSESAAKLIDAGQHQEWWQFLTHIIPESMAAPFVEGNILQIIFIAVVFGIALNAMGKVGAPVLEGVQRLTGVMFKILSFIMKAAPVGAFGAMAYAVGKFGVSSLTSMGGLIALFYITSILFVVVVLGSVMAFLKLNIFKMIRHLKEEYMLILGTSTAEPALPGLMRKLEHAGVKKETVGLVVPTGYSFNLDGAAIYLSLAALYIAQATNTDLSIGQQLGLLAVMLLTSKGAAGVAGGGFIALTATLTTLGTIPAAGIMLIFGIDKFMSECRAIVNFTGNAVATLFIAWWDRTLDADRVRRVFNGESVEPLPIETPSDLDEVTGTDNHLIDYGYDRPVHPAPVEPASRHASDVEPAQPSDRRPAYSEIV
ncbi:C4-dicarboxylate transporter DctA [Pseudarthrobacter sp. 1C304]|uniref:C4-dicarboxylate transporter DctA n=1 Tax=Pseudarthrobacter sp. 1C304 TaxID=3457438 RepID=UPI003FCF71E4